MSQALQVICIHTKFKSHWADEQQSWLVNPGSMSALLHFLESSPYRSVPVSTPTSPPCVMYYFFKSIIDFFSIYIAHSRSLMHAICFRFLHPCFCPLLIPSRFLIDSDSDFHFLVGKMRISGNSGPGKGKATRAVRTIDAPLRWNMLSSCHSPTMLNATGP